VDCFRELGLTILDQWQRADFDEAAFPDVAADALRHCAPSSRVDANKVIQWVQHQPTLPPQADIDAKFGQPPITVFHCERFYIDVLFWIDGTTALHQHAFCGAFHVMDGSSIQGVYRFNRSHRYSELLWSGTLDLLDVELLVKGDVRPIRPADELLHSLFHLDRPSVSVVVRTPGHTTTTVQLSYSRAGLAFDTQTKSPLVSRRVQVLDLLHATGHPEFESSARESIRRADSFQAFRLATHLAKRFEKHDAYVAFLESIRPAHGELLDALIAHAKEERREKYIIARRQRVRQAGLRFFLALLLNVPDRSRILEMTRRAYPDRDPHQTIVGWLGELAKLDSIHAWASAVVKTHEDGANDRVLDVALDETAMKLMPPLLEGMSDSAAIERAANGSPMSEASKGAASTCQALRRSILLRPLFIP